MKYRGKETPQIRSTQSGASPGDTEGPLKFRNLSIIVGIQTLEGPTAYANDYRTPSGRTFPVFGLTITMIIFHYCVTSESKMNTMHRGGDYKCGRSGYK